MELILFKSSQAFVVDHQKFAKHLLFVLMRFIQPLMSREDTNQQLP